MSTTGDSQSGYAVGVIAELFDLTPRHVQRLAKDGVLPKPRRGLYPLAPCIQGYVRYLRRAAQGQTDDDQLQTERKLLLRARREQTQLQLRKLSDEVIDRSVARRTVATLATEFRSAWEIWPSRIAATVANELRADEVDVLQLLEREVRAHLAQLATETPPEERL